MKLHLPTALFALAVLPAAAWVEDIPTIRDLDKTAFGTVTPTYENGNTKVHVGETSQAGYINDTKNQIILLDVENMPEGKLVLDKAGDEISCDKPAKVLYINGDLNVSNGATVYVGGSVPGNKGAYQKGGIIAGNVTIDGVATSDFDFEVGAARFESLTVNSGRVQLRRDGYDNGGTIYGAGADFSLGTEGALPVGTYEFSNVAITNGLTVNAGTVNIGKGPSSRKSSYFGDFNMGYFQSSIGGKITQNGGTLDLHGQTYLYTSEISQTGGTMTIAGKHSFDENDTTATVAEYLRVGQEKMTITQGGDSNKTVLNLQGIIVRDASGSGELELVINQTGSGTINMETAQDSYRAKGGAYEKVSDHIGSYFTTGDGPASVIKQSGSGTININSDYRSATFNVEQTGKGGNITIGATGKLKSSALTLTDAAKFSVVNGGQLMLDNATLSYTVTDIGSITSSTGAAVYADGAVVSMIDSASGSVSGSIVSAGVVLGDEAFAAFTMNIDALATGDNLGSFTVTLATGLAENAITFDPAAVGITTEASYTVGGESVTVAYNVTNVGVVNGNLVATVGATVTAVGGSTPAVPEPATATLSLLALVGLCARRRRK